MHKKRLIARLDIKNDFVIKGIQMDGLRKVGDPNEFAVTYYQQGVDEIVFMDAVASYYDRNSLFHIIEKTCESVFVPLTVGGGIRTVDDIRQALRSGADKVAINTKAIEKPDFIREAAAVFGSQCIVASIVSKQRRDGGWEAYVGNGREPTGVDVVEWAESLQEAGAGEIILTSLDQEGTRSGFDIELCKAVRETVSIPLIVSGGAGSCAHVVELTRAVDVDAVAVASILHYDKAGLAEIRDALTQANVEVRQ